MTLGIIDVGTNSIHLLIGILGLNGKFHVILKERDLARLGEGGLASNRLTPKAMRRALDVLRRYGEIMKRCGVDHVQAVATSAVREARNGPAFVRRVRSQLRLPLRIITGREEGRLIYLGVMQAQGVRRPTLIVTTGGGSTQLILGDGAHLRYVTSVPLGGARLAQQFIRHDPPRPQELAALASMIERQLGPRLRRLRRSRWTQTLGSSATIHQLMLAARVKGTGKLPAKGRPPEVGRRELQELVKWLARSTARERIQLDGLDPRREDLALPTGMVLLATMDGCGVRKIRYAPGSLREGLVVDYLVRHHARRRQRLATSLEELFGSNGARDIAVTRTR